MNELGAGVVADASAMQAERGIAQRGRGNTWNANVDRAPFHVQAVWRDAVGRATEKFICPGRAVTTNDIDFGIRMAESECQVVKNVEHLRVEMVEIAGPMIPQEQFEAINDVGKIRIAFAIDDIDTLVGVRIVKAQPKLLLRRPRGCGDAGWGDQEPNESDERSECTQNERC